MNGFGRILILGSRGQVGRELQRTFAGAGELICGDRKTVDLANGDKVRQFVRSVEPDLILNAAAYTAVDRAESEPELAAAMNTECPRILAEEASRLGCLLVHYSTDYVFDGSKAGPWVETDTPNPLNVYGVTKLAGEDAMRQIGGKYLIFRTSWVYGPHGKNFLLTMLRLGRERDLLTIVDDQIGAPTTSAEIADATRKVVQGVLAGQYGEASGWAGVYHMTCAGSTTWYGFAKEIFNHAEGESGNRAPELRPIPSSDYPTPARRPRNSVLSNAKLREGFGVQLADWTTALDRCMHQLSTPGQLSTP